MIKFENVEVVGFEAAIRGMRNPMNSWEKSDSYFMDLDGDMHDICGNHAPYYGDDNGNGDSIGPNDLDLMKRLRAAGTDHRKFMRMIVVYVDVTAPLYWWKEFDTYKVGVVANSCSTMHKIADKEFVLDDFSCEHLIGNSKERELEIRSDGYAISPEQLMCDIISMLNACSEKYSETKDKKYWHQLIQLLPSSYNQRRTVMLNYEVLANIYKSRKNHKLDEWAEHECTTTEAYEWGKNVNLGFCDWIKTLPYSELITEEEE